MPQFKSKHFHHTHTPPPGEGELVSMQIDIRGPRPYLPARVNDGVPKKKKKGKDAIYAIAMIHVSCHNGRAPSSSKSHSTHTFATLSWQAKTYTNIHAQSLCSFQPFCRVQLPTLTLLSPVKIHWSYLNAPK